MPLHRLVQLIESHSKELAGELLVRARQSPHLASFGRVPDRELRQRVYEVYSQLGQWLMTRTETDVERQYCEIGARRYNQGVPLCELLWAIILTKDNLWDFLYRESWPGFEMDYKDVAGNFARNVGRIFTTVGTGRQIQLAARFVF